MDKIVKDYLKKFGYENCIDENQESRVKKWLDIYKGKTKDYMLKIYNGKKYVNYEIKSLNMPSQVCGDLADFFFNEKLDITISDVEVQKAINTCLEQNNFLHNGNKLMQLVKALGTGAFVPYLDKNILKINYMKAPNIVILKANTDDIVDVLFWSQTKTKNGNEYIFNLHTLEEDGYVIYNSKQIEKNGGITEVDLGETAMIKTKSYIPKFGMLFTPEINNFDINTPYGVSCYANANDVLLATDRAYDCLDNEVVLGKKRVYVTGSAIDFNTDADGNLVPIFDPNDIAYYAIPGDETKDPIKESSFDLRIEELSSAVQMCIEK